MVWSLEQLGNELWRQLLEEGPYLTRVLVATLLGGVLGWEREKRDRPAGLRTFMMVAMGSALFTVLSKVAFPGGDESRVAANILTGIGFIGAGTVFRDLRSESGVLQEAKIRGVTTAAALWSCAGIGMAAGAGMYVLAIATTLLAYALLTVIRSLEKTSVGPRGRRKNRRRSTPIDRTGSGTGSTARS